MCDAHLRPPRLIPPMSSLTPSSPSYTKQTGRKEPRDGREQVLRARHHAHPHPGAVVCLHAMQARQAGRAGGDTQTHTHTFSFSLSHIHIHPSPLHTLSNSYTHIHMKQFPDFKGLYLVEGVQYNKETDKPTDYPFWCVPTTTQGRHVPSACPNPATHTFHPAPPKPTSSLRTPLNSPMPAPQRLPLRHTSSLPSQNLNNRWGGNFGGAVYHPIQVPSTEVMSRVVYSPHGAPSTHAVAALPCVVRPRLGRYWGTPRPATLHHPCTYPIYNLYLQYTARTCTTTPTSRSLMRSCPPN